MRFRSGCNSKSCVVSSRLHLLLDLPCCFSLLDLQCCFSLLDLLCCFFLGEKSRLASYRLFLALLLFSFLENGFHFTHLERGVVESLGLPLRIPHNTGLQIRAPGVQRARRCSKRRREAAHGVLVLFSPIGEAEPGGQGKRESVREGGDRARDKGVGEGVRDRR